MSNSTKDNRRIEEDSNQENHENVEDNVSSNGDGLTERLRNIFTRNENDDDDDDLLLQQNDREDNVLQWIQALDLQVMGACRADERLKPLLKLNVSGGGAEDHLLAHLSQV